MLITVDSFDITKKYKLVDFDITKKYKLVDVEGYLYKYPENRRLYDKYFTNDILNNDLFDKYDGMITCKRNYDIIVGSSELKYLEEIKEEEEPMKEINYTSDWYMDCPKTKEEWSVFVQVMELFGVNLYDTNFDPSYSYIFCKNNMLVRGGINKDRKKVTLLEAITLLQRPVKTEQQIRIEKLEQTIAQAQEQIKNLKATVKQ